MDLLLPECLYRSDDIIIRSIKNAYSKKEIEVYLAKAEESISCLTDTFPSFTYTAHSVNVMDEQTDSVQYYSGEGLMLLFNKKILFERPYDLKEGEVLTRDYFTDLFRKSDFYTKLKKEDQ